MGKCREIKDIVVEHLKFDMHGMLSWDEASL